jgi:hypothetical protein
MALQGFSTHIKSLINRIGRDVTYREYVNTGTDYNPVRTPVDITVKAAIFNYSRVERGDSIIQSGDRKIAIASDVAIDKDGLIIDDGVEYRLVALEEVGPQSEVLMYVAQGRA